MNKTTMFVFAHLLSCFSVEGREQSWPDVNKIQPISITDELVDEMLLAPGRATEDWLLMNMPQKNDASFLRTVPELWEPMSLARAGRSAGRSRTRSAGRSKTRGKSTGTKGKSIFKAGTKGKAVLKAKIGTGGRAAGRTRTRAGGRP